MWSWLKDVFSASKGAIIESPDVDHERDGKATLGLVVGHDKATGGAVMVSPYKVSEYIYNSEIAELVKHFADNEGKVKVEVIFRDKIGISGAYALAEKLKCDAVIELHFNSANGKASGTETLCSSNASDKEFAAIVQRHVCEAFSRVKGSRGVKVLSRSSRGALSCYSFSGGSNCLIEPAFGDVFSEATMMMERKNLYALSLLSAFKGWCDEKNLL